MIAFTIAARNFIPYARALHASLIRHHPDVQFVLALCDLDTGFDHGTLPFEVLNLAELRDTRVWAMAERYDISELCTAIKPLVFQVLMDRHPGAAIVYFDPDIWVTGPLVELERLLIAGAQAVLTPHVIEPSRVPELRGDHAMLRYGIYNLGFLALREGAPARHLLAWWAQRLERDCRIDLAWGLYVDQKWADLFPALMDRVAVLRHPGYNVAYWNVLERDVRRTAAGWHVNGQPLRFVHFSGHELTRPDVFSRHAPYLDYWTVGDLFMLQAEWRDAVLSAGFREFGALPYGFKYAGDDWGNLHTPVELADQMASGAAAIGQTPAPWRSLFHRSIASWTEWEAGRDGLTEVFASQRATERALLPDREARFLLPGQCGMCQTDTAFATSFDLATDADTDGRLLPNWREHLDCRCRFTNRTRGAMQALQSIVAPAPEARIYVTEQVTRLHGWLAARWPGTVGSEYLGAKYAAGQVVDGVRHEDLCRLSFDSDAFDVVVSLDVMEHVADLAAALGECWRVLAPGGTLLFAAPTQFEERRVIDRVLAAPDGTITYLLPPEYHGNPMDPHQGSLCFRTLGLEVLDRLRAIGFADARCELYWSRELGLLGSYQNLFIARKPASAKRKRRAVRPIRTPVPAELTIKDIWAYGKHDPGLPTLQAYLLDPAITAVMARLALFGSVGLVDRFRMVILLRLLRSTESVAGEVWELGVYRGGTALLLRNDLARTAGHPATVTLRLFDTFAGMPATDAARDVHVAGDFADTSLQEVQALVGDDPFIDWRAGLVPATFAGLDAVALRFVHVDLDIYAPIVATIAFAWPRMGAGAIMVFDDYGFQSCPGARMAVDEFCAAQSIALVPLPSGQAFIIKPGKKC